MQLFSVLKMPFYTVSHVSQVMEQSGRANRLPLERTPGTQTAPKIQNNQALMNSLKVLSTNAGFSSTLLMFYVDYWSYQIDVTLHVAAVTS